MADDHAAAATAPNGVTCAGCGAVFPRSVLACPQCQRLVYADALQRLQERAGAHAARGELSDELSTWREALMLLPEGSRQQAVVRRKIEALAARTPAASAPPARAKSQLGKLTGLSALALLLWKFKAVLLFLVTKGKLLLLGMTKWSTLLSMALSLGVYFTLWGFWFALGFVLSIYVHEMGHVFALRRLGIAASAPMFIPGVGAFVRMKQYPATPSEDALVGLAGPVFGLGAAFACLGVFHLTGEPIFAALARTGGWLNLFNLMPLLSLDGGRGFRALSVQQRWLATFAIALAWVITHEHVLMLVGIAAVANAALASRGGKAPPKGGDKRAFYTYIALTGALAWLSATHVPGTGQVNAAVLSSLR